MSSHRLLLSGLFWLSLSLLTPAAATAEPRDLVLVGAASANHSSLSRLEVRKIFLGYPVTRNGKPIYAVRNKSDLISYQIFLQKFIHLSAKNYERRLLSKTFRTGTPKVSAASSLLDLKTALANDPANISIMWRDEAAASNNLRIIQTLWTQH